MGAPHKGLFVPKNPSKYISANINNITYRSSWEQSMMQVLDSHPSVVKWASEPVKIPYYNPFKTNNKNANLYVPDFFVAYIDRNNVTHQELIEIKPSHEVPGYRGKVNKLAETRQILNMLKWKAAIAFCNARNWKFRVATEVELFGFKKKTGI